MRCSLIILAGWFMVNALPCSGQIEEEELLRISADDLQEEELVRLEELSEEASIRIFVNRATPAEFLSLHGMVHDLAEAICNFRDSFGAFASVYELLSVPGMEKQYLRSMAGNLSLAPPPARSIEHTLSLRSVVKQEIPSATPTRSQTPEGSPYKVLIRYRAEHRHWIWGFKAEKDAGEPFGMPHRPAGFDFYSGWLGYRGNGFVRQALLGDYRISMGHGLLCNQSFSSGSDGASLYQPHRIKILKPHTSSDEYHFFRGGAFRMQHKALSLTLFGSAKPIDGNIIRLDSVTGKTIAVSTIQKSGMHATLAELEDRHALKEYAAGLSAGFRHRHLVSAINLLHIRYDAEISPSDRFADRLKFRGNMLTGVSIESGWYSRKIGMATEVAFAEGFPAWNLVLVIKPNDKIAMWLSPRSYAQGYYTPYASSISRGTFPSGEKGLNFVTIYTPEYGTRITARTDIYHITGTTGAPVTGRAGRTFLLEYFSMKNSVSWLARLNGETQDESIAEMAWTQGSIVKEVQKVIISARGEVTFVVSEGLRFKTRADYRFRNYLHPAEGWQLYAEADYRVVKRRFRVVLRHGLFNIDHYDLRVYVREPDALWAYSLAILYGKGTRTALLIQYKIRNRFQFWCKAGATSVVRPAPLASPLKQFDCSLQINLLF
jgi:hypothetical protein